MHPFVNRQNRAAKIATPPKTGVQKSGDDFKANAPEKPHVTAFFNVDKQ